VRQEFILAQLQHQYPEAIDQIIENKEKLRDLNGFANADFVVIAKKGFQMIEDCNGKVVGEHPVYQATHGYSPDNKEMDAAFFIVGSSIETGKNLGRISMTAITPFIAQKMNIEI
jgi:predicted AlkP superfamily pyrophosphatase or phosphodiesterase